MQAKYIAPRIAELTFELEGPLCLSDVVGGFGAGGFEGDEDGDIDFF